jgi:hypothetical protein
MNNANLVVCGQVRVDPEIFQSRLEELGWSYYELSKHVARVRRERFGDVIKNHASLVTGIQKTIENPEKATWKQIFCIVNAMQGKVKLLKNLKFVILILNKASCYNI